MLDPRALFLQLGLSLLLGLLVGLQRERSNAIFGMRTFPLITILGTLSALLSSEFGNWIIPVGLLCVTLTGLTVMFLPINYQESKGSDRTLPEEEKVEHPREPGTTTIITTLVMYCVGALLAHPEWTLLALEIGGLTAVLLQFKLELHHLARQFGENDMRAIMQFVMITFVILPVLPNRNFGPYNSFNPFEIGLMIVLIVGLSLSGYIAYKFMGKKAGVLLGGVLGGMISSTATVVCYSRMVAGKAITPLLALAVTMIASTFLMVRTLILLSVVSQEFFYRCLGPCLLIMVCCSLPAILLWLRIRKEPFSMAEQNNPTEWKTALTFGLLYALISFAMKAGSACLGDQALYGITAISGFTETSAVTISTARLALSDPWIMNSGWKLILTGILSNFTFKLLTATFLTGYLFGARLFLYFALPIFVGISLILFL